MSLKPQDILLLLKLAGTGEGWTYPSMAESLGMSVSEVHAAARRAQAAGLLSSVTRKPNRPSLLEFLIYGLRYVFPAERGAMTRGFPTAHAANPLRQRVVAGDEPPPVWPDPAGDVRGEELRPLYRSAPSAARKDPALYELLALVDALRGGRARERTLAVEELRNRLAA